MKLISKQLVKIEEYAYDTQEECNEHAKKMIHDGFEIRIKYHDVYQYYREYAKCS